MEDGAYVPCRQVLATRESMQDHGQLSTLSPSVAYSPVVPSPATFASSSDAESPVDILDHPAVAKPAVGGSVIDEAEELGRQLSEKVTLDETKETPESSSAVPETTINRPEGAAAKTEEKKEDFSDSKPAESLSTTRQPVTQAVSAAPGSRPPVPRPTRRPASTSLVPATAAELSAQLHSNPTLAELRPELHVKPVSSPSLLAPPRAGRNGGASANSPILVNPNCSGYFVEPVSSLVHVLLGWSVE